jgi:hypothetical protein
MILYDLIDMYVIITPVFLDMISITINHDMDKEG